MEATTATEPSPTVGPIAAAVGTLLVGIVGLFAADSVDSWDAVVVATCLPFLAIATWIDLRELRIPNRLNATFAATVLTVVTIATIADGGFGALGRSVGAAFALFAVYLALHAISPGGFGGGDVKLGFGTGALLGWFSWSTLLQGALAAFVLNGVIAVVVLAATRGRLRELPFGPSIAIGALLAIVAV